MVEGGGLEIRNVGNTDACGVESCHSDQIGIKPRKKYKYRKEMNL